MVMLVLRGLQLLQILRRLSFRFTILVSSSAPSHSKFSMAHTSLSPHWHLTSQDMRIVRTGNNLPSIFVLERIESDPEYDALKEQLYGMEQYVAMSTSTFMAVC